MDMQSGVAVTGCRPSNFFDIFLGTKRVGVSRRWLITLGAPRPSPRLTLLARAQSGVAALPPSKITFLHCLALLYAHHEPSSFHVNCVPTSERLREGADNVYKCLPSQDSLSLPLSSTEPSPAKDPKVLVTNTWACGSVCYTCPAGNTPSGWEDKRGNLLPKKACRSAQYTCAGQA
jgi:hypothetical protein